MALDLDLGWSDFERVGQSRVLRSSVIWVVATPVVARLLDRVNGVYEVPFLTPPLQIELGLPFSFQASYVAACCFTLASVIYTARCPWLVSRFESYTHFESEGRGERDLIGHLAALVLIVDRADRRAKRFKNRALAPQLIHKIAAELESGTVKARFTWSPPVSPKPILGERERSLSYSTYEYIRNIGITPEQCPNIFALLRDEMDELYQGWRWALLTFYGVGFALLALLFVQNAIAVFG